MDWWLDCDTSTFTTLFILGSDASIRDVLAAEFAIRRGGQLVILDEDAPDSRTREFEVLGVKNNTSIAIGWVRVFVGSQE